VQHEAARHFGVAPKCRSKFLSFRIGSLPNSRFLSGLFKPTSLACNVRQSTKETLVGERVQITDFGIHPSSKLAVRRKDENTSQKLDDNTGDYELLPPCVDGSDPNSL
jgi:hypothetical protein